MASPYLKYMKSVLREVRMVLRHKNMPRDAYIPKGKDWESNKTLARQKRLYDDRKGSKMLYPREGVTVQESRTNFHPSSKVIF